LKKKEDWLTKQNKKEIPFNVFLLSKKYKEKKSSKLKEKDNKCFTNMLKKLENKFNLKKKHRNKQGLNTLKKAENLNRKCPQNKKFLSKSNHKSSSNYIIKEFLQSIALN